MAPKERFILPITDFSLIKSRERDFNEWLKTRPDIVVGEDHAYKLGEDGKILDKDGQPIKRDVEEEKKSIRGYFSMLDKNHPRFTDLLRTIVDNPQSSRTQSHDGLEINAIQLNPMDPKCRVAIIMPAKDEERIIYNTLSRIAYQKDRTGREIDPGIFEITVIVNCKKGEQHDQTYEEVARFKNEFPHIRVNAIQVRLNPAIAKLGFLRKVATDITLARALQRGADYKMPLYIQSEDADLLKFDPHQIDKAINTLDAKPWLDAAVGHEEMPTDNDLVLLRRRCENFMRAFARKQMHNIPPEKRNFRATRQWTFGTNTIVSAETYALIGGFDPSISIAEDLDLGQRISILRGRVMNNRFTPNISTVGFFGTRSASSPRRYLWEQIKNKNAYSQENFENGDLRKMDLEEIEAIAPYRRLNDDEVSLKKLERVLGFSYDVLKTILPEEARYQKTMRRCLIFLGFKTSDFELQGRSFKIKSMKNILSTLEKYRKRNREKIRREAQEDYIKDKKVRERLSERLIKTGTSIEGILRQFGNDYTLLEQYFRNETGTELVRDPMASLRKEIPIKKSVSVVIPVFNNQEALTKSLIALNSSSMAIKHPDQFEIIVIDDGSSQGNINDAIKNCGELNVNLRVVKQPNSGKVGALYTGAQLAKGNVIITMDPDFLPSPQTVEETMKRHQVLDNIVTVGFRKDVSPTSQAFQAQNIPSTLAATSAKFSDDVRFIGDNNFYETEWFKESGFKNVIFDGHWALKMSSFCHETYRSAPRQSILDAMAGFTPGVQFNPGDEILLQRLIAQGLYIIPGTSETGFHLQHESHMNPQTSQKRRDLMGKLSSAPFPVAVENPYAKDAKTIIDLKYDPKKQKKLISNAKMRNADVGELYLEVGLYKEALGYLEKALQIDPTSPGLHALYAITLIKKHRDLHQAVEYIRKAEQHRNNHGLVQCAKGLAYVKMGDYVAAKKQLQNAISSLHPLAAKIAREYIPEKNVDFLQEAQKYMEESKKQPKRKEKALLAIEAALIKNPSDQKARDMLSKMSQTAH